VTYRSRHRCDWAGDNGPCHRGYQGEPKAAAWAVQPADGSQKPIYVCFDHVGAVMGSFKQHDELTCIRLSYRNAFGKGWTKQHARIPLGHKIGLPENRRLLPGTPKE